MKCTLYSWKICFSVYWRHNSHRNVTINSVTHNIGRIHNSFRQSVVPITNAYCIIAMSNDYFHTKQKQDLNEITLVQVSILLVIFPRQVASR